MALHYGAWAAIALAVATQQGCVAALPLFALEVALALVQTQATAAPMPNVWLLTADRPEHAGPWGLSRSARAEVSPPLQCIDASGVPMALSLGPSLSEPEAVLRERKTFAPRLTMATPSTDGLVRLHFHARGAISNLFLEPLASHASLRRRRGALARACRRPQLPRRAQRARRVPGRPRAAGRRRRGRGARCDVGSHSTFGLGHAPLASVAIAAAPFLASKPQRCRLSRRARCPSRGARRTRPSSAPGCVRVHDRWCRPRRAAWGSRRSSTRSGCSFARGHGGAAAQARPSALRRASRPVQLARRRRLHMRRDAAWCGGRLHAVLNSLSLDFIAASFASLGEGGAFEEIGKRGIWASHRHIAASATTSYCAIALDADMTLDPRWMRGVLSVACSACGGGRV